MKAGAIHFIIAFFLFAFVIYTSDESNDTCYTVISCAAGLFNTILGAMFVIIEKIDSHKNKTTKKTSHHYEQGMERK